MSTRSQPPAAPTRAQRYRRGDPELAWTGERQVGRTLDDIRPDHVERYRFAASKLLEGWRVLDAGCGVGYGTQVLAPHAAHVHGADASVETIEFAARHWSAPNVSYATQDLMDPESWTTEQYDAIVALEVLEHVSDLPRLLSHFHAATQMGGLLIGSTPNQTRRPYDRAKFPFHFRHYAVDELGAHLREAGYVPLKFYCQDTDPPTVRRNDRQSGLFLLFTAART